MSMEPHDWVDGISDCCGSTMYLGGICKKCGEHADERIEDLDTLREFATENRVAIITAVQNKERDTLIERHVAMLEDGQTGS